MRHIGLAVLAAAAVWGTLAARDDERPGDLARIPAAAKVVASARVADLWGSDLGKEVRKAFGKGLSGPVQELKEGYGLVPENVERVTVCVTDPDRPESQLTLVRTIEKIDAKAFEARLGAGTACAFLDDGRTIALGTRATVDQAKAAKPGKPPAALAEMLSRATKHSAAAYVDPAFLAKEELPPFLLAAKPLLAATGGVAWADVGYTTKLRGRAEFADEKAAARGRKALDAGRALASLTLGGVKEQIAGKSKPLGNLLTKVEAMLDEGTVEQKGAGVDAALELTLEKAAVAELLKEVGVKAVVAAGRARGTNNLKQLGLAMHGYHDTHGALPPAAIYDKDGKALLSWRVLVLQYVEQGALYKEFKLDEPWDSEHNKKLITKIPPVYVSPRGKAAAGETYYRVFHGKGAAFEGKRGLKFSEFTDGLSNTLLVAEGETAVPWTKPDELAYTPGKALPKVGALWDGQFIALLGDGSVRSIDAKIKAATLDLLIRRNDGTPNP